MPTFIAPAANHFLGLPGPVAHAVLLTIALGAFAYIMLKRVRVLRLGVPDPRFDRIGQRLRELAIVGFGQSRQPRYLLAGTLHILIFAGFMVLSLRSLTLLGEGFVPGYTLPLLGGAAGRVYASLKDWMELLVLVACALAITRRAFFRPARYHDRHAVRSHAGEAYVVLGLIALLMVADGLYDGTELAIARTESLTSHTVAAAGVALPLTTLAGAAVGGLSTDLLTSLHLWSFWVHNIALLFFLCYLPVSKHFHVITSLPNVFLANLTPAGAVKPPRHGVEDFDELESLGVARLEDFTWKHLLDFYSCTDCGRCSDACPAYATGTPLSPRMISIKARDLAYEQYPIVGSAPDHCPDLVGEVITEGELWSCTTCGACEEACPILIEYVDKIVDMRRHLVEEGDVPAGLQKAMASLEKRGNPYGKMPRKRGDWLKGDDGDSGVRALKAGQETTSLFFTDSAGAYDPRIQQTSRSFGRLLTGSGEDVGTLGKDEVDSGHEARRIGEEGLFESLREQNEEALDQRSFYRIVTCDPHAMNSLRHDYGVDAPVQHHTAVLAELVAEGRLQLGALPDDRTYTFHDPCYLGRHNGEYDAPRDVLDAVPGLQRVEMERSRNTSFCCGGGSLYLFNESEGDSRMGEQRVAQAAEAGADVIVTACPFCLINLEDAVKTTGREGTLEIIDIAELIERSAAAARGEDTSGPADETAAAH